MCVKGYHIGRAALASAPIPTPCSKRSGWDYFKFVMECRLEKGKGVQKVNTLHPSPKRLLAQLPQQQKKRKWRRHIKNDTAGRFNCVPSPLFSKPKRSIRMIYIKHRPYRNIDLAFKGRNGGIGIVMPVRGLSFLPRLEAMHTTKSVHPPPFHL